MKKFRNKSKILMNNQDNANKVVLLGASGVGKTSIVLQLKEKVFRGMVAPTVGSGVIFKNIQTEKGVVPLKIWDTAGEERYRSFSGLYSQSATAGIFVFDLTDQRTFDTIDEWIAEFEKNANADALLYLAGNKLDLIEQRELTFDKAFAYAQSKNMKYFEVSAKTGEGVELLFTELAKQLGPMTNDLSSNSLLQPKEAGGHSECC